MYRSYAHRSVDRRPGRRRRRTDAVEAVERSLVASCRMYAAEHRLLGRLLLLAELDPDAATQLARSQADRVRAMEDLALRLSVQGRLRMDLATERAADVLCLLTSFAAFEELHSGRRLDADACARTLVAIARATLLADGHRHIEPVGPAEDRGHDDPRHGSRGAASA